MVVHMAIYGSWESIFQMETPILINPVQKKWHKQDIYGDLGLATANFAEIFLIEKVDFLWFYHSAYGHGQFWIFTNQERMMQRGV